MHPVQQRRGTPFREAPPQRRTADPIPGGPQFAPLHPFTQKEPQCFDHRLGGAARTTLIAVPPFNPVDQTGHQAACRRSHRPSPVSIARQSWAHSVSPTAALKGQKLVSHPQQTSENRALVVYPVSEMRLLWVWSVTRGTGPGWGGCDDPSGARIERGGSAQAGADDALTETRRGAGPPCADYPARG